LREGDGGGEKRGQGDYGAAGQAQRRAAHFTDGEIMLIFQLGCFKHTGQNNSREGENNSREGENNSRRSLRRAHREKITSNKMYLLNHLNPVVVRKSVCVRLRHYAPFFFAGRERTFAPKQMNRLMRIAFKRTRYRNASSQYE
jgi:hypothetical protein